MRRHLQIELVVAKNSEQDLHDLYLVEVVVVGLPVGYQPSGDDHTVVAASKNIYF